MKVPVPLVSPKQFNATSPVLVNTSALAGCVTVMELVVVQFFASVTWMAMVPIPAPLNDKVVAAVVVVAPVVLEVTTNVNGAVPPLAVNDPAPFVSPKQFNAMLPVLVRISALAGCVTVMVLVAVQPFASFTFTVMLPTPAPVNVRVVAVVAVVPPVVLELTVNV